MLLASLFLAPTPALAQSGGTYDLGWNTIDGGGATFSSGGNYVLGGTVGQPDAGQMSGGTIDLDNVTVATVCSPSSWTLAALRLLEMRAGSKQLYARGDSSGTGVIKVFVSLK